MTSPQNNFYVYVYYDADVPFYVGKGRNSRDIQHWKNAKNGKSSSNRLMRAKLAKLISSGDEPNIIRYVEGVSEADAYQIEQELIEQLGRKIKNSGPLLNVLSGNNEQYPEWRRQNQALSGIGKKLSEVTKAKISRSLKTTYSVNPPRKPFDYHAWAAANPEKVVRKSEKISAALLGTTRSKLDENHKLAISSALIGRVKSAEHMTKIRQALTGKTPNSTSTVVYNVTARTPDGEIVQTNNVSIATFCNCHNINISSFHKTLHRGTPIQFGQSKGWQLLALTGRSIGIRILEPSNSTK